MNKSLFARLNALHNKCSLFTCFDAWLKSPKKDNTERENAEFKKLLDDLIDGDQADE